jgi:signal transduction histidine kinase
MFLSILRRTWKTIGFRLTVWYSVLFIASSLAMFGLAYLLLSSSLRQIDQEAIQSELNEYVTVYRSDGRDALMTELEGDRAEGNDPFVVRLADPRNRTVFLIVPDRWATAFNVTQLEQVATSGGGQWQYLGGEIDPDSPFPGEDGFEIASVRFADGWLLQVGNSTEKRKAVLARFRDIFAVIVLPVILVGLAGGMFLALRALRPVRTLIHALTSIIQTGETKARVPVLHTGDELDELGTLFNTMLGKIESLINGMQAALDNVAHDLRSPMTRLRGIAEVALGSKQNGETSREALADCLEESDHVLTMLNQFMDISEAETGAIKLELEPLNIRSLIEEVLEVYRYVAEEKDIAIQGAAPEELLVVADSNRLRQALANLLDNAVKYTLQGGKINIEAFEQQQQIAIVVRDTGIGIPHEDLPKIWDRLYRGDKSRSQRGLGLGLSLVRAMIHAHQGRVEVISEPNKGSQFILYLPVKPAPRRDQPVAVVNTH